MIDLLICCGLMTLFGLAMIINALILK